MSGDKNDLRQDQGALRILEALSAVDEELLERSGVPVAAGIDQQDRGKTTDVSYWKNQRKSLWQYGRICAACLALIVVGALSWNGLRMIWGGAGAAMDSSSSGGANQAAGGSSAGAGAETGSYGAAMNGGAEGADTSSSIKDSYAEVSGDMEEEEKLTGSAQQTEESSTAEGSILVDMPDNSREITEEEARSAETLGAYLPAKLPAGYVFESARINDLGQLTVCWLHGMDMIQISVAFAEAGELKTTDINRPETYNEWLYEIPYKETVPEEYWQTFDNPVFAAEDLSLEVVSSRMKTYEDAGDTDTPRGSFSVLYPEGVLVRFNGRGTAEEIWNMFSSLQR